MERPIINIDNVQLQHTKTGDKFESGMASLGQMLGAKKLGYRLCVIPPGKRAWPYHAHIVNEEMVFVISGAGTLRYADHEFPVVAGDVIAFDVGADKPHQIINSSNDELKYLCISTMEYPEVMFYPDSDKFGVLAGSAPGGDKANRTFEIFAKNDVGVNYWEGEV